MVNISDMSVRVYCAYKSSVSGAGTPYDKPIFVDQKHWDKIASICERIGATPERFIATQFVVLDDVRRRLMTPAGIYKPIGRAIEVYNMFTPSPVDYDRVYVMLSENLGAQAQATPVIKLLENPYLTFPAWFRVVRTPELTAKIMDRYFKNACEEVEADNKLKLFLKKENLYARFECPAV